MSFPQKELPADYDGSTYNWVKKAANIVALFMGGIEMFTIATSQAAAGIGQYIRFNVPLVDGTFLLVSAFVLSPGGTYSMPNYVSNILFKMSALFSAVTFSLPQVVFNGQDVILNSKFAVTSAQFSAGLVNYAIVNAPLAITTGGSFKFRFSAADSSWYGSL